MRNVSFNPVIHVTLRQAAGVTVNELDGIAWLLKSGDAPDTSDVLLADARETLAGPPVEDD